MFCLNCGKETQPKGSACTHCGFDLGPLIALLNEPDSPLDAEDRKIRTAEEVARRAVVLATVTSCAAGAAKVGVVAWLKKEKLWREVTPSERKFLLERASAKRRIAFSWKIEALVPLLWAMNKIEKMPRLNRRFDADALGTAMVRPPHSTRDYIASSSLRSEREISEEYEKVYEAHWKVRDARLKGRSTPKTFDPEVVYERHYGFNWVIGYEGQAWDDITTDT